MIVNVPMSEKQKLAWRCLNEDAPMQLVYGGGARGGKTFFGALWVIMSAMKYAGSQWFVARHELKALKRTTLRSIFQALRMLGLEDGKDYNMNAQDMVMTIFNKGLTKDGKPVTRPSSAIFFGEMADNPSDPEFDRLGSYDLTGIWLDEAQEISKNAKDTLQARFTLLQGEGWTTWPKALYTCNPSKNWIYSEFWKPLIKENKQITGKKFITALYSDNPYIDHQKYRDAVLSTNNTVKIERLLKGNFEYDDTEGRLVNFNALVEMFGAKITGGRKYITCDPAGLGEDLAVIMVWEGLAVKQILTYQQSKVTGTPSNGLPSLEHEIRDLMNTLLIPPDRVVVDAVGLGIGIVDAIGCRSYVGNRSPVQPIEAKMNPELRVNFATLNDQCAFMLAEAINHKKIACIENGAIEEIKEELDMIVQTKLDQDSKFCILPKDKIKQMIGRSPNYRDAMMMRMIFELDEMQDPESEKIGEDDYEKEALKYINGNNYLII